MNALFDLLKRAEGTGEVITLAYGGGSRPGEARQVVVLQCLFTEIRAREPESRTSKIYKLTKILWAETSSGKRAVSESNQARFEAQPAALPTLKSIAEYADLLRAEVEGAGWELRWDDEMIGVSGLYKKGGRRKHPSVRLIFNPHLFDVVFSLEENDLVAQPREVTPKDRPWRVDSWLLSEGKTFGRLDKAMDFFVAQVRASDPTKAQNWNSKPNKNE